MPAADIMSYPNYGDGVDCDAGTFNGRPYGGRLKSIEAPDPKTVVFTFCNPDVAFLSQIAFKSLAIDDSAYLIAHMPDKSILRSPNGTGPYKLTSWESGSRIDFEANPDYWGEQPLSPLLELQWSDQSAARLLALQSDSGIDGIDNPGKDDLPAIQADSNLTFYERQGLNTFYLGMNNTMKPFDDVRVRQAIAMGIDRQRIVDNFLPAGSEVAHVLHAVRRPARVRRRPLLRVRPCGRQGAADRGGLSRTASRPRSRSAMQTARTSAASRSWRRRSRPS